MVESEVVKRANFRRHCGGEWGGEGGTACLLTGNARQKRRCTERLRR